MRPIASDAIAQGQNRHFSGFFCPRPVPPASFLVLAHRAPDELALKATTSYTELFRLSGSSQKRIGTY